jgi:ketosteroid isomerase-like protein
MDSDRNIELVRQAYAAFLRGDIPAIIASLGDDVQWITPDIGYPGGSLRRGKQEVAQFFQIVGETWQFQDFQPLEYIASGDRVVVRGTYTATARSTGRTSTAEWIMLWTVRNGKLSHFQEFTDTAKLLAALTASTAA